MSDESVAVILRELAWTIHKRAPDSAGVGPLPTAEVAMLKQVVDAPGSTVRELADALGLQQSNASAALRVLAGRGLVVREAGERDKRTVRILPTEQGRREHVSISAAWAAGVEQALTTLSPVERDRLQAASDALLALTRAVRSLDG